MTERLDAVGDESGAFPGKARRWWMVGVLFVTALASYSDRLILSILVDPLTKDLRITDSQASLLQGIAFTLVYVFMSVPLGRLADRWVRQRMLVLGSTLWAVATIVCGLASGFWPLFAGRLLVGVGEAVLVPAGISLIADSFPSSERGRAIGLFAMGTVLGGPLGISAGGILLGAAEAGRFAALPLVGTLAPWRLTLVLVGAAGLVAPLLLQSLREPVRRQRAADSSFSGLLGFFGRSRRLFAAFYAGMALLAIGDYGLLTWASTILGRNFGWSAGEIGVAVGIVTAVAGVIGSAGGGWLSDRAVRNGARHSRLDVPIAAALIAAAAAAVVSVNSGPVFLAGIGLWTLASTVASIGALSALQDIVPNEFRATSASVFTFTNTLIGLGAGPTLIAATTDYVYGRSDAVALASTTVVAPAALLACALFVFSRSVLKSRAT